MKKFFLMIVIVSVLFLSGCNAVRIRDTNATAPTLTDDDNGIDVSQLDFDSDIFGINGNTQGSQKGGTETTLYGGCIVYPQIVEGTMRMILIDNSGEAHFLCMDNSCNHAESTCAAWTNMYNLQYYRGNLYFLENRTIKKYDGSNVSSIYTNDSYVENFGIRDGQFYFADDNGICTVDMETLEKKCICDIRPCVFSLNIYNDVMYFASETFQLYSMNYDGSDLKLLSEDYAFEPQYNNGYVYYRNIQNNQLLRLDVISGETKVIFDDAYQLCACKDALYFIDNSENNNLYRYSYDTESIETIGQTTTDMFCVYDQLDYILVGESITYTDAYGNVNTETRPYIIDKDGKNKREVILPQFIQGGI